jgi:putative flippase GtrA
VRFAQFLSVGIIGGICDVLVLAAVVETTRVEPFHAKFLSAEAAILVMFLINERWTFAGFGTSSVRGVARRLIASNIVRAGGASVAWVTLLILTRFFGVWYLAANVIGIGVGFVLNYTAESLVTWRAHRSRDDSDR